MLVIQQNPLIMFKTLIIALLFAAVFAEWQTSVYPQEITDTSNAECDNCVRALRVIYSVTETSGCAVACSPTGTFRSACNMGCITLVQDVCPSDCARAACTWFKFC
ncbi:hypothetical protein GEMRC1_001374 [Eukaryota sp. GEM-RC1]